jgi:uncharacterized protein YegP (UPF0339 family)
MYKSEVYQTESGKFAWVIYHDNDDIARGTGYEDLSEAEADMQSELENLKLR